MEWNAQGKGVTYRAFHFTGHRYVEKLMTGFRIDGRTVPLEWSNFALLLGSSGVVSWVANPLKNNCENANTHAHGGVHLVVLAHLLRRSCWSWIRSTWRREKCFLVCFRLCDGYWIVILCLPILLWIKFTSGLCSPLSKLSKTSKIIKFRVRSLEL
jgi:hypothetical protein